MPRKFTPRQWDEGLEALHRAGIPAYIDCGAHDYFYRLTGDSLLARCRRVITNPNTARLIAERRTQER